MKHALGLNEVLYTHSYFALCFGYQVMMWKIKYKKPPLVRSYVEHLPVNIDNMIDDIDCLFDRLNAFASTIKMNTL